jgi:hypothetical protein
MTPTPTDPCTKRRRDDTAVPFLLENGLQGKGNKRERPNSVENSARSLHPSPCIAQLQTMATLAVDSTAPEAAPSNHKEHIVDFVGVSDAVYPLIWSFLLDSTSGRACLLDFKSISSFMLVNKTSKGAFDDCRGWRLCAQALKHTVEGKRLLINCFMHRAARMGEAPSCETEWARETHSSIVLIQKTLLPQANRLAVSHGGEEVTMGLYDSDDVFSYIRLVEDWTAYLNERRVRNGQL